MKTKTTYNFTAVIYNPLTLRPMNSTLVLKMQAIFAYKGNDYGNKYHVLLRTTDGRFEELIDLRYDDRFDSNNKKMWIQYWANAYWTGLDGAYALKELTITDA